MKTGIHIFVGHYGSGKSECAVNYAIDRANQGCPVAMADMDIVNPYFRTRQQAKVLGAKGIQVISSNFDNDWRVDIPGLSSELQSFFVDNGRDNVIDVGGNAVGARVLARFRNQIEDGKYEMWFVINANRYETQTAEQVMEFAETIQESSGLRITGLINNTHMLAETTVEDILRGNGVIKDVSTRMKVPCVFCACPPRLLEKCKQRQDELLGTIVPIEMYLRPNYLMD